MFCPKKGIPYNPQHEKQCCREVIFQSYPGGYECLQPDAVIQLAKLRGIAQRLPQDFVPALEFCWFYHTSAPAIRLDLQLAAARNMLECTVADRI